MILVLKYQFLVIFINTLKAEFVDVCMFLMFFLSQKYYYFWIWLGNEEIGWVREGGVIRGFDLDILKRTLNLQWLIKFLPNIYLSQTTNTLQQDWRR